MFECFSRHRYEEKIEGLRRLLYEFERGTVPVIRVENDEELLQRARDYLSRFKEQELGVVVIDRSLLPVIERLVVEIETIRSSVGFRLMGFLKKRSKWLITAVIVPIIVAVIPNLLKRAPIRQEQANLTGIQSVVQGSNNTVTINNPIIATQGDQLHSSKIGKLSGDYVEGDKIVINSAHSNTDSVDNTSKFAIANLKINRAFEDYDGTIETITKNFSRESDALAGQFNSRRILSSGMHVKAQMDLSIATKERLEQTLKELERHIQDILVEIFGKTTLSSFGNEFTVETDRLNKAKKRLNGIYRLLSDSPKSWEMKVLGEVRLTKDFNLTEESE